MVRRNSSTGSLRSSSQKFGKRRENSRKLTVKPQYTLEETYITVFTEYRIYEPDGDIHYELITPRIKSTQVEMFDAFRNYLDAGKSSLRNFCKLYGLSIPYLNGLLFCLTGLDAMTYRISWQMMRADELLRYTDMSIPEVARKSGIGTSPNFFYACRRDHGCAPTERRATLRQPHDLGRYR